MMTASRFAAFVIFLILVFSTLAVAQSGSRPETLFGAHGLAYRGLEDSYKSTLALRAGLHESQFSAGVGLQFKGLIVDYAHNNWQIESAGWSSSTSALSLTYQF